MTCFTVLMLSIYFQCVLKGFMSFRSSIWSVKADATLVHVNSLCAVKQNSQYELKSELVPVRPADSLENSPDLSSKSNWFLTRKIWTNVFLFYSSKDQVFFSMWATTLATFLVCNCLLLVTFKAAELSMSSSCLHCIWMYIRLSLDQCDSEGNLKPDTFSGSFY